MSRTQETSLRWLSSIALAACVVASAPAALAQSGGAQSDGPHPGGPSPPSAVQLGRTGLERFEKGAFDEAYQLFSQAESLKHSPVFVLYMARSKLHLRKLLEARELFRKTAAEEIAPDAPASFAQARVDAKGELVGLELRIATVQVRVEGPAAGVTLTIDGKPAEPGKSMEHDPGVVLVRATHPDHPPVQKSITLQEGERDVVFSISLGGPAKDEAPPDVGQEGGGTYLPGAIVLGVGGAGLVVGAITGIVTLGDADEALAPCTDERCPRTQKDAIDAASTTGNVSTISFIAGGALVATGVVLLLVLGDDGETAARASGRPHLALSPFWSGASGAF